MASSYRARVLDEADFGSWTTLLEACPGACIYSHPAYLDALCRATGGTFQLVAVEKGDEMVGGLAAYQERQGRMRVLSPRLLLYYLSPVLRSYDTRYPSEVTSRQLKIWGALADWVEAGRFDRVMLRCTPGLDDVRACLSRGWVARPTYSYVVALDDLPTAWGRVEQNLRRLVGRAEAAGLTLTEDDDFGAFHALHQATMDRKDQGTYLDADGFRRYWQALHDQGLATLLHARLPSGRSVAAQLVLLGPHGVAQIASAAADVEHQTLGTNAFLRWKSFELLARRGYQGVDLTDAALNPVTRFKSQLGGDLSLAMVVEAPRSLRWRTKAVAARGVRRLRGAAGSMVRRVLREDRP